MSDKQNSSQQNVRKNVKQSIAILNNTIDDYEKRGGDPYYSILALNMLDGILEHLLENNNKELK